MDRVSEIILGCLCLLISILIGFYVWKLINITAEETAKFWRGK
jgi:TRAP-type C4-dicarboxylate transport system permease small subunit